MNTTASGKSRGRLYDLIVIGGGSAGLVVAGGAAQLGARVALIEKKALGGDCLYTGCVPSKTLIRSARFAAEVRRAEDFGFATWALEFKDREFASITDRVARVIETVGEHDRPERFAAWGVEVIFAAPRFLSPRELEIIERDGTKRIIIGVILWALEMFAGARLSVDDSRNFYQRHRGEPSYVLHGSSRLIVHGVRLPSRSWIDSPANA